MSEGPALLYLEADDEITAVVRRVRAAEPGRVVIVAPGRSRATSSAVALRLLARAAEEDGRELAVVGDALTRSLAGEAGITAYATVEDARAAVSPAEPVGSRHAAIHVVRGPGASEETAPAMPAAVASVASVASAGSATETRPVSVAPPRARFARPARSTGARRVAPLVIVLAVAGTLLLTAVVAAATLLPAATIHIAPRSEPVGPVPYRVTIDEPERLSGTVTATATVTATGTYAVQSAATGTVVFLNWNFVPVEVPAGTLVAAGEQAFATGATITVEAGELTGEGTIQAGEGAVGVTAAAVGPAANVAAGAIDQVLDQQTARRLRGFPNNPQRLVTNPEATTGGIDTTGVEIVQADVDAALSSLRQSLTTAVTTALEGTDAGLYADPIDAPTPVVTGVDGLVGTRDQERVDISGELAYDRLTADADEVEALARDLFARDAGIVPEGHDLLDDATEVQIGEVQREGDALVVAVTVTGRSAPMIDREAVIERVTGLSEDEARAALADIGSASVELWPGWVASVPDSDWRVDVVISGVDEFEAEPSGS